MSFKVSYVWILLVFALDKLVQAVILAPNFVRNYLDDLLLIPLVMGASLQLQHYLVAKNFNFSYTAILATCGFFTIAFEGIAPLLTKTYTLDPWDIMAYFIGAVFFALFMNYPAENSKE
ncbi:MAG: hypothetical protein SGJ00_00955 [bacterium]|nr:hypothetical protein [bacterium]